MNKFKILFFIEKRLFHLYNKKNSKHDPYILGQIDSLQEAKGFINYINKKK